MSTRRLILRPAEVRALLESGSATVVRPITLRQFQPSDTPGFDWTFRGNNKRGGTRGSGSGCWQDYRTADLIAKTCPLGAPDEVRWVAETWCPIPSRKPIGYFEDPKWKDRTAFYEADNDRPTWAPKWRASAQMPAWASRLSVRIASVAVEQRDGVWRWVVECERVESTNGS